MPLNDDQAARTPGHVPKLALLISLLSLWVPVLSASMFPDFTNDEYGVLVWLLALIPAFLLSHYRGWRGASLALAGGMAAFTGAQLFVLLAGTGEPRAEVMIVVVVLLLGVSLGSGWSSGRLRASIADAERLSLLDAGTELPNRRHALLHLQRAFSAGARGTPLSVVLFDLDRFKHINDSFGHSVGDVVLRSFAASLAAHTRRDNLCARFGGEEFIAILDGVHPDGALLFAERVRKEFAAAGAGQAWDGATVSAGIAGYEAGMASPEVLVAAADQALYRAKEGGRDRAVVLEPAAGGGERPVRLRETGAIAPRTGKGETVLVVDDDAAVLRTLLQVLKRSGYDAVGATHPEQALGIARALGERLALVVTDIMMPGMSGFRLVDMIGRIGVPVRVLYISGQTHEEVDWSGVPGALTAFLPKPFSTHRLLESVRAVLDAAGSALPPAAPAPGDAAGYLPPVLLEAAYSELVLRLATVTEYRDDLTGGHAQRVGWLAGRIAEELELSESEVELIERAAPLHDIGKVAVPDAVLRKPGPLTTAERAVMEEHAAIGARILSGSVHPLVQEAERIALGHHERWDGKGYPAGVAAQDIPLSARITAVADMFDALTSVRPYRTAVHPSAALQQVMAASGTRFDPQVVTALVRLVRRGGLAGLQQLDAIGWSAEPQRVHAEVA